MTVGDISERFTQRSATETPAKDIRVMNAILVFWAWILNSPHFSRASRTAS